VLKDFIKRTGRSLSSTGNKNPGFSSKFLYQFDSASECVRPVIVRGRRKLDQLVYELWIVLVMRFEEQ
jgi:hypothetical protein